MKMHARDKSDDEAVKLHWFVTGLVQDSSHFPFVLHFRGLAYDSAWKHVFGWVPLHLVFLSELEEGKTINSFFFAKKNKKQTFWEKNKFFPKSTCVGQVTVHFPCFSYKNGNTIWPCVSGLSQEQGWEKPFFTQKTNTRGFFSFTKTKKFWIPQQLHRVTVGF